ncbi:capsule assembly Wzi family protein [Acinetobacter nectaris]|uniref:capsule assembly Wzi family protein n=1 Tax=Acinetobacter nectaris TaxID=1219382 RepID=UPI001F3878A3|nr:capsule assembly Wzi family protein [Acinetobacter nectaris]MCF9045701.1 capsule assembly Wzi family protein [Acinetobacter nectaris]
MKVNYKTILLSTMACLSSTIYAQAFLTNDNNLRTDLNWLNQQGVIQLSTSTWPLSTEEVTQAIKNAKVTSSVQQQVIDAVQAKINEGNNTAYVDLATATTQNKLPSSFGDSNTAQSKASFTLQQSAESWDAHLQLNLEANQRIRTNSPFNVNGSYIAGKLWNQWVSFGEVSTWWGPGHDGSLIRGDATRPVPGFMMQRAEQKAFETKWLSWIGPWQYQLFAGQLQHYMAVPDTKLLGMRVTIQPFQSLELGASRAIQWGGRGRDEGASSLWKAFVGQDNVYGNTQDPSNQLGGFDARLNLKTLTSLPLSIYGQIIGEDEAGKLPSRNLYLAGVDFSSSIYNKPYQLYIEWADTRTDGHIWGYTYNHHIYRDGYYQYGYPIGHAMGGDGQMYSIGGNIQLNANNRITTRILYANVDQSDTTNNNIHINHAFPYNDILRAFELSWDHQTKTNVVIQINGWLGNSDHLKNDSGASLSIKLPLNF